MEWIAIYVIGFILTTVGIKLSSNYNDTSEDQGAVFFMSLLWPIMVGVVLPFYFMVTGYSMLYKAIPNRENLKGIEVAKAGE
jgi:hypothetical protein